MAPIVVVGSGLAGHAVIRELRRLDPAVALTVVARDDGADEATFVDADGRLCGFALLGAATASRLAMTRRLAPTG